MEHALEGPSTQYSLCWHPKSTRCETKGHWLNLCQGTLQGSQSASAPFRPVSTLQLQPRLPGPGPNNISYQLVSPSTASIVQDLWHLSFAGPCGLHVVWKVSRLWRFNQLYKGDPLYAQITLCSSRMKLGQQRPCQMISILCWHNYNI